MKLLSLDPRLSVCSVCTNNYIQTHTDALEAAGVHHDATAGESQSLLYFELQRAPRVSYRHRESDWKVLSRAPNTNWREKTNNNDLKSCSWRCKVLHNFSFC